MEQGRDGVAIAAYAAVMDALDLAPTVKVAEVQLNTYPQLRRLAWNRRGVDVIPERDALALYERHWDLVDVEQMEPHEQRLLRRLVQKHGHGVLPV